MLKEERQQCVDRIMKANQKNSYLVLLLKETKTSNKIKKRIKKLLQRLNLIKCSNIYDALKVA